MASGDSLKTRLALVKKRKRRQQVRDLMLHGGISTEQIARRLGVATTTVKEDIKIIEEDWLHEDIEESVHMRSKLVRHLFHSAGKAMTSFDLSKQPEEEIVITRTPKTCRNCSGLGILDENDPDSERCPKCLGEGKVFVETETRKVKGQAGDAAFLNVYNKSIEQIAKLVGVHQGKEKSGSTNIKEAHIHMAGSNINWDKQPRELILKALQTWDEAKANQKVIDVTTEEDDGNFNEMEPSNVEESSDENSMDDKSGPAEGSRD